MVGGRVRKTNVEGWRVAFKEVRRVVRLRIPGADVSVWEAIWREVCYLIRRA